MALEGSGQDLTQAFCRTWEGSGGQAYRVAPEGAGWSCSVQSAAPGEPDHFTASYGEGDGLVWWGGGGTFFFDPGELAARPGEVQWYLIGDLRRLPRSEWRPRIVWRAVDQEPAPPAQPVPTPAAQSAAFRPPPGLEGMRPFVPPGTFAGGPNLVGEQGPDMKPKLSVTDTEASTGHISEATCSDESEGEHSPAQRVNRDAAIQNVPAAWRRPPPGLFSAAGSAAVPKRGRSPPRGQSPPTAPPTVPPTAPPTGPPTAPPTAPPSATPKPWRSTIAEPAVGTAKLPTPPAGTSAAGPTPLRTPLRTKLSSKASLYVPKDATANTVVPMQRITPAVQGLSASAQETTNCCLVMRDGLLQLVDFPQQPVACQPPHDPPRGLTTRGAERGPR